MTQGSNAPTSVAVLSALFKAHLSQVKDGQEALLSCLKLHEGELPLVLGEELEDVANRYLDMAEIVSDRALAARRATASLLSGMVSAEPF